MKYMVSCNLRGASAGIPADAPPALDSLHRFQAEIGRFMMRIAIVSLVLAPGCDWFSDPTPEEARVLVSGSAGSTVELIVSSKFVAGVNAAGVTRVEILESDTIATTLPFDRTFSIRGDYKFFAQAARTTADVGSFRMEVFIDSDREFDESGPLLAGAPFRFVFQFNQFLTDNIDVVF